MQKCYKFSSCDEEQKLIWSNFIKLMLCGNIRKFNFTFLFISLQHTTQSRVSVVIIDVSTKKSSKNIELSGSAVGSELHILFDKILVVFFLLMRKWITEKQTQWHSSKTLTAHSTGLLSLPSLANEYPANYFEPQKPWLAINIHTLGRPTSPVCCRMSYSHS